MVYHLINKKSVLPAVLAAILMTAAYSWAEEKPTEAKAKPSNKPAVSTQAQEMTDTACNRICRIIPLKNAPAETVVECIREILPDECQMRADVRGNFIILSCTEEMLPQMMELIGGLDVPIEKEALQEAIFTLKYADAESISDLLQHNLLDMEKPTMYFNPLKETNAIIVQGPAAGFKRVALLLDKLDRHAETAPAKGPRTVIYNLKYADIDEALRETTNMILKHRGQAAFDENRRCVIATGDHTALESLEKVLSQLDTPSAPGAWEGQGYHLRVVWLISGIDSLPAVPDDLQETANELARIGISDLRLAAQTLVHTSEEYNIVCPAVLEGHRCNMMIEGELDESSEKATNLDINIRTEGTLPGIGNNGDLCHLKTEVVAPLNHPIVIGAMPIGQKNSVFVIQVLPDTPKEGESKAGK